MRRARASIPRRRWREPPSKRPGRLSERRHRLKDCILISSITVLRRPLEGFIMSGGGNFIISDLRPSFTQRVVAWLRRLTSRS